MDKKNEQVFFTLGFVTHLPAFNAAGELSDELLDMKFTLGPGQTPNRELLWDPNSDDTNFYQVKMKAFISTSAAPPANSIGYQESTNFTQHTLTGPQPGYQSTPNQHSQHIMNPMSVSAMSA